MKRLLIALVLAVVLALVLTTVLVAQTQSYRWVVLTYRIRIIANSAAAEKASDPFTAMIANYTMRSEAEERFHAALDEFKESQPAYFEYLSQKYGISGSF